MDPDQVLADIRARLAETDIESDSLAELVLTLCNWLDSGGFLPKEWQHKTGYGANGEEL